MVSKEQVLLNKRILIIGSDTDFLNSVEKMFTFAGSNILVETSLIRALSSIKVYNPNIVIVETSLSINTGISSSQLIKTIQNDNKKSVPIVVVFEDDCKDSLNSDNLYFLDKKNLELINLVNTVKDILFSCTACTDDVIDISEKEIVNLSPKNDLKILIVEDDPLLRDLLSAKFTRSKISHQFCHNGSDVILMLSQYQPDILILDIRLPGKNGFDVLKEIREKSDFSELPVIVFSNKDNDEDRKLAKYLGVDAFLIKIQTDLNELIKIIFEKTNRKVE